MKSEQDKLWNYIQWNNLGIQVKEIIIVSDLIQQYKSEKPYWWWGIWILEMVQDNYLY